MRRLRAVDPTEQQIQSAYFDWWRRGGAALLGVPVCLCFAVPNGSILGGDARLRAIQMARLKRAGLTPGVSDVLLLVPRGGFHGLILEFKRKSEKPTTEQEHFLFHARGQLYNALVVKSTEEAIHVTKAYLQQPRNS